MKHKYLLKTLRILCFMLIMLPTVAMADETPEDPTEHTHVASSPVTENRIDASCDKEGSYDSVVYCEVCKEELSRDHCTIAKLTHKWNTGIVTKEATTKQTGEKTYTCTVCGAKKVTSISKKTHFNEIKASNYKKTYNKKSKTYKIKASCLSKDALTYHSNNKNIKVNKNTGKVTVKAKYVGSATITIKSPSTNKYEGTCLKIKFTVLPSKTKIASVINNDKGTLSIFWNKNVSGSGYQLQYSTSSSFKKHTTTKTIKKKSTGKLVLKGIPANKTYYIRIRTMKIVNGKKYYSAWSSSKKGKVKEIKIVYQLLSIEN